MFNPKERRFNLQFVFIMSVPQKYVYMIYIYIDKKIFRNMDPDYIPVNVVIPIINLPFGMLYWGYHIISHFQIISTEETSAIYEVLLLRALAGGRSDLQNDDFHQQNCGANIRFIDYLFIYVCMYVCIYIFIQ